MFSKDENSSTTSRSPTLQKQYQAFIVLFPVGVAFMFLLLFYLLFRLHAHLRRQRSLRSIGASLEDNNGNVTTFSVIQQFELGLTKKMREALPVILYQESLSATDAKCSVCLGNYEADDRIQQIPACGHMFHLDCIARWLITHTTCPLCRLSLLSSAKTSVGPIDVQVEISDGSFVAEKSNPTSLEESSKAHEKANNEIILHR